MMGNAGLSFYPNFLSSSLTVSTLFATSNFLPFTDSSFNIREQDLKEAVSLRKNEGSIEICFASM